MKTISSTFTIFLFFLSFTTILNAQTLIDFDKVGTTETKNWVKNVNATEISLSTVNDQKDNIKSDQLQENDKELDIFTIEKLSKKRKLQFEEDLKAYSTLKIKDFSKVYNSFKQNEKTAFKLKVPISSFETITLNLAYQNIYSDDFKVIEKSKSGDKIIKFTKPLHFAGTVEGQPSSTVGFTVAEDQLMGVISYGGHDYNLTLQERSESEQSYLLFRQEDYNQPLYFSCGTPDKYTTVEDANVYSSYSGEPIKIKLECDFAMYLTNGRSTTATRRYATNLFNVVANIFRTSAGINLNISELVVWTRQDPYRNSPLDLFMSNNPSFNGDIAHLLSTSPNRYGVADRISSCSDLNRRLYSISSGLFNSFNPNLSIYSWDVGVFAHELGHNLGSAHTHACAWNRNNTAIDGCGYNEGFGGCPGANPRNGGTIMSYCHLTEVGINLSRGFHPQVAERMRDIAGCLSPTPDCYLNTTVTHATCTEDGQIYVEVIDGQPSYQVRVQGGNGIDQSYQVGSSSFVLSDVHEGNYTLTITDARGCTTSKSVRVNSDCPGCDFDFSTTTTSATCTEDGAIYVEIFGGQATYQVHVQGGNGIDESYQVRSSSFLLHDLREGNYTLTITDARGCTTSKSVRVNSDCPGCDFIATVTSATCRQDGSIDVEIINGQASYQLDVQGNNGINTSYRVSASFFSLIGMPEGTYSITIADAEGCTRSKRISVHNNCTGNVGKQNSTSRMQLKTNSSIIPNQEQVLQNYPNPFSSSTILPITLTENTTVKIEVFSVAGKRIYQKSVDFEAGEHQIELAGNLFPESGIYFYRIHTDSQIFSGKMSKF